MTISKQFSELSYILTKRINNDTKKKFGIYFTPINIIKLSVDYIINFTKHNKYDIKNILEPSCGSCEFIKYLDNTLNDITIDGIEQNKDIFNEIKNINFKNKISLENDDFLEYKSNNKKYNLIIGNPPFFVLNKSKVDKKYYNFFDGRPNIYILFIIKSLSLLDTNGILSFVLPKNFLNCLYYDKLRQYIIKNFTILSILDVSNEAYIETKQDTIILILQNKISKNEKFCIEIEKFVIFNTENNIKKIKNLFNNDIVSLNKLNFNVSVGPIVWNQVKNLLTNDQTKTRLIYSSDIIDNKLSMKNYSNKDKKNFINKQGKKDIILVINRGYGKGEYKFNYCLINSSKEYLIENHLITIEYNNHDNITVEELLEKYNLIINSFENKKTKEFISLFFNNNAINTTELQYILPIFLS